MTRLVRLRVLVLAAGLGLASALWFVPAHAAAPDETGWWYRSPTFGLPIDLPPPAVPEGGMLVGTSPDGPHAVGALRVTVPDDVVDIVVELDVASSRNAEEADILACATSAAWEPAAPGAWGERPAGACSSGLVAGTASSDGSTWSFVVGRLRQNRVLDIVIQPAPGNTAPLGFELTFDTLDADAVAITTAPDTGAAGPQPVPTQPPVTSPPATTPTPSPAPVDEPGPTTTVAPTTTAIPAPAVSTSAPAPDLESLPASTTSVPGRRRLLAVSIAAGSIAMARFLGRDPLDLEVEAPVGVGRFARPPSGDAP